MKLTYLLAVFFFTCCYFSISIGQCTTETYSDVGGPCDKTATDCKIGLYCIGTSAAKTCQIVTTSTPCTSQNDCGPFKCYQGTCHSVGLSGESCVADVTCLSNQCVNGKCAAKSAGTTCLGQDCAIGLYCGSSATSNTSTCQALLPMGSQCGAQYQSTTDYDVCAGGICNYGATNTCVAVFSASNGQTVSSYVDELICPSTSFAIYGGDDTSTCQSSAACQTDNDCESWTESYCTCASTGSSSPTNGTCTMDACSSAAANIPACFFNSNSANGGLAGLFTFAVAPTDSARYQNCYPVYQASFCCSWSKDSARTANRPDIKCSSASLLSISFALMILALLM